MKMTINVFCVGSDGGREVFTDITSRRFYIVKVTVLTGRESASTQSRVRFDPRLTACSAHLINRGLVLASGGIASVQFISVGPVERFMCTLKTNGHTQAEPCERKIFCSNV